MEMLSILHEHYCLRFTESEMRRDAGSVSHLVYAGKHKYFLRVIKPAFLDTARMGANIQLFLQSQGFPVPPIILTKTNQPYAETKQGLFILYRFIEGEESNPEEDAEALGALVGRLHSTMGEYCGELLERDKHFFIGRYLDILEKKQYPQAHEFQAYGSALWDKIKGLPRGYAHGDLYDGNILKTPAGEFYVLDFDTSCRGFPLYDLSLLCNKTHYFDFDQRGYEKSLEVFRRFLPVYLEYSSLTSEEINAFGDLIALYHFALQATIIEAFGLDCVDNAFLDKQLDWLYRWEEQGAKRLAQEHF